MFIILNSLQYAIQIRKKYDHRLWICWINKQLKLHHIGRWIFITNIRSLPVRPLEPMKGDLLLSTVAQT